MAVTAVLHILHFSFALADRFDYRTHVLFRGIDLNAFKRFASYAINFSDDNFWTGYLQFIAFTTHVFNQDGQVQLATSGNNPSIRGVCRIDTQRYISMQLFHQTFFDFAGSDPFTFAACERRVVCKESHLQCRLIDMQNRQSFTMVSRRHRFPNKDIFHTGNGNQIASFSFFDFDAVQTEVTKQFCNSEIFEGAVQFKQRYLVPNFDCSAEYATDTDTANKVTVVQQSYLELQWFS
ncbi:hypothetical protein SDC9_82816 [bioreactor metagenome]|uniref:Uncharacterized protein n=1 Tax=bioreactor metagenome TaxID=1076179 RepID=A0A644Z8A1_9ZZZZ